MNKEIYHNRFSQLIEIAKRYNLKEIINDDIHKEIDNFRVIVPVVGSFSSGKTSIINVALNENIFKTNVSPETAIPVEICSADRDSFYLVDKEGKRQVLTREEIKKGNFHVKNYNYLAAFLNNEILSSYPHVKLVDMPGFESGMDDHDRAIIEYKVKSMAYLVVIDAETGGLKQTAIDFLKDIKVMDKPAFFIVNKADKKETELDAIIEKCKETIIEYLDIENVMISPVSARKGRVDAFYNYLAILNDMADEIFEKFFTESLDQVKHSLKKSLELQRNNIDLSVEEIELKEKEEAERLRELDEKIAAQSYEIEKIYDDTVDEIRSSLEQELLNKTDELAHALARGRDVTYDVSRIIKRVSTEKFLHYFQPRIRQSLNMLKNEIGMLDIDLNIDNLIEIDRESFKRMIQSGLVTILSVIGVSFGGPVGAAIGAIIGFVANLLGQKMEEKIREQQIKLQLPETIKNIISNVVNALHSSSENILHTINEEITSEMKKEESTIMTSLENIKNNKRKKIEEQEAFRQKLVDDMYLVDNI